jgi:hypothetical protein
MAKAGNPFFVCVKNLLLNIFAEFYSILTLIPSTHFGLAAKVASSILKIQNF